MFMSTPRVLCASGAQERSWNKSCGLAPRDIRSPETHQGEEGRLMSIFCLFVTNRQLLLNYQPFSP